MKIKKGISVFLFLVMSIQVLPLQQIATWLFSNPAAEELVHSINPVKAKSGTDEVHPPFALHTCSSGMNILPASSPGNHLHDEALYIRHADDILAPPPNC